MQDFEWPPAQKVWQGIESELNRKKKRRPGFFWMILLLMTSGGYVMYSITHQSNQTNSGNALAEKKEHSIQHLSKTTHTSTAPSQSATSISNDHSASNQQLSFHPSGSITLQKTGNQQVNPSYIKTRFRATQKGRASSRIQQADPDLTTTTEFSQPQQTSLSESPATTSFNEVAGKTNSSTQFAAGNPEAQQSLQQPPATKKPGAKDTLTTAITAKKTSPQHKWSVLLSVAGGVGATGTSLLNDPDNPAAMLADYTSTPGPGSNLGSSSIFPSATQKNICFTFGALVSRQSVNGTFRFQTGLQYQFLQTKQHTGGISTVNFSARAARFNYGTRFWYSNQFHLIRVPVELQYNLKRTGNIQPAILTGISAATLISSNALQSNNQLAVYYNDNGLFRKLFWEAHAGIPVRMLCSGRKEWQIMPEIRYQLNSMAATGFYKHRHLSFAGLSIRKFL